MQRDEVVRLLERDEYSVLVNASDLPLISEHFWWVSVDHYYRKRGKKCLRGKPLVRVVGNVNGRLTRLHQFLLNPTADPTIKVDHKDHDTLNNCRSNLRTYTDNSANDGNRSKSYKPKTSRFKGVHFNSSRQGWTARIIHKGKSYHLGIHHCEESGARAYNRKARELYGEFACLNKV